MNAVESLLTRLNMSEALPAFRAMGIDRILSLRHLPEDQLRKAVPNDEQRQKLVEAIQTRGNAQRAAPAAAPQPPRYNEEDAGRPHHEGGRGGYGGRGRGGRGGFSGPRPQEGGPAGRRVCRQFMTADGCKFADSCKYSHDPEMGKREAEEGAPVRSHENAPRDGYSETINIPADTLKFLLGCRADRLRHINEMCNTTNGKIERPSEFSEQFPFTFYGTPENVARAKNELLKAVGLKNSADQRARFEYANSELSMNQRSVSLLAAVNLRHKGSNLELSENVLKQVIGTFRFEEPQKITHFWANTNQSDKEKFDLVAKIVAQIKGVQAIVFAEPPRVQAMGEMPAKTSRAFNGVKPHFITREMSKKDRMEALEAFKNGEENEHGVKQRLLVTTTDYAKLARKTLMPYVNLVFHFTVPKTLEFYLLQSMLVGRHGTHGASVLFVNSFEVSTFREWQSSITFEELKDLPRGFAAMADALRYDTKAEPLTTAAADPPVNWRELLEKEVAEKEAKKAAKAAGKA